MPRMQVYLPDDLYDAVKSLGLPASELLQHAVRAELERHRLLGELDAYLAELHEEVGEPTAAEWAEARALVAATAEPGGVVLTGDVEDLSALAAHADGVRVERI